MPNEQSKNPVKGIKRMQIADLAVALKDMEPYVKDPKYLIQGKRFSNFDMLVREAWVNWLVCVVLKKILGRAITFQEDKNGDGIIVDKCTGEVAITEHVCALDFPAGEKPPTKEERIIWAFQHKAKKPAEYQKGKVLIIFIEGADIWYPNRVGKVIDKNHYFRHVLCVGLLSIKEGEYSYSVTYFSKNHSPTYKVTISKDFTKWNVDRMQ